MPDTEHFRWYVPYKYGPKQGKLHLTRWRMTVEEARARYGPDVQPDPLSREVRSGTGAMHSIECHAKDSPFHPDNVGRKIEP